MRGQVGTLGLQGATEVSVHGVRFSLQDIAVEQVLARGRAGGQGNRDRHDCLAVVDARDLWRRHLDGQDSLRGHGPNHAPHDEREPETETATEECAAGARCWERRGVEPHRM